MKINYGVDIPNGDKKGRPKGEEHLALLDFIESYYTTMSFTYENKDESYKKYQSLRGIARRHHYNVHFIVRGETVYVVKGERK